MKSISITFFFFSMCFLLNAQYNNEPSEAFPYGKPHAEAPQQIKDFAPMIGKSKCESFSRKQDGSWNEAVDMLWTFKYIMDGKAVQDETLKADGAHSGSIRQFNADSSKWYVHYYASNGVPKVLPAWEGERTENKIVLYREQKAPNGTDGFYRLTFYDFENTGYKWIGEWVDKTEKIVYPTWKINCTKQEEND
ncbi:hypothetical protein Q2T40_06915 [Winogradskyella maritima]|uniref:Uncharacterized protein n=1 Tax=Winogradskyella maritima TaxID=1517766 RepID=A0ABV8AL98_9FLAO|nr:hypothetical protein [Winogradskyella maritima]